MVARPTAYFGLGTVIPREIVANLKRILPRDEENPEFYGYFLEDNHIFVYPSHVILFDTESDFLRGDYTNYEVYVDVKEIKHPALPQPSYEAGEALRAALVRIAQKARYTGPIEIYPQYFIGATNM